MSETTEASRIVVVERLFQHPVEKVWRALTEGPLLAQWLLKNDFEPVVGRPFQFRADPVGQWNGVIDCEVLVVEPLVRLSYRWRSMGSDSVVLFTLTSQEDGTHLRMEHSGFRADQNAAFQGATYGWNKFLGALETTLNGEVR